MANNKLIIGGKTYPDDVTQGDRLMQSSCFLSDSLVAESLGVDTLSAVVRDYDRELYPVTRNGYPILTAEGLLMVARRTTQALDQRSQYGQPVEYYRDKVLLAKLYLESVVRVGRNQYQISCVSAVGLLLTDYH